jgi:hypothetical protein
MKIILSQQRRDDALTVTKQGDALTINGTEYDFTDLPEGATLPLYSTDENGDSIKNIDCEWIVSDVQRTNGELELTLLLPHGANASEAARFPEPIIDPANGELELPK